MRSHHAPKPVMVYGFVMLEIPISAKHQRRHGKSPRLQPFWTYPFSQNHGSVENGGLKKMTGLSPFGSHFPLPWLWEEGFNAAIRSAFGFEIFQVQRVEKSDATWRSKFLKSLGSLYPHIAPCSPYPKIAAKWNRSYGRIFGVFVVVEQHFHKKRNRIRLGSEWYSRRK